MGNGKRGREKKKKTEQERKQITLAEKKPRKGIKQKAKREKWIRKRENEIDAD